MRSNFLRPHLEMEALVRHLFKRLFWAPDLQPLEASQSRHNPQALWSTVKSSVTNTEAAIASSTTLKFGVVVKFMSGTGPIYVGATGVTSSTGYELKNVGDETPLLQVNDAATVFVISANASGDTACFIGA